MFEKTLTETLSRPSVLWWCSGFDLSLVMQDPEIECYRGGGSNAAGMHCRANGGILVVKKHC